MEQKQTKPEDFFFYSLLCRIQHDSNKFCSLFHTCTLCVCDITSVLPLKRVQTTLQTMTVVDGHTAVSLFLVPS